jgi:hypothetical protein
MSTNIPGTNIPRTRKRKGKDGFSQTIYGGDRKILFQE